MTILLSGATGFLGSYLLKSFVNSEYKVIALKRATSDTYRVTEYLNKAIFYNIDEIELTKLFEIYEIDIVLNTVTNYGRKDNQIISIVETNLLFGLKLLEESVNHNVEAFINTDTLLNKTINSYALSKSQLVDWMKFLSNKDTKMINIKIEHMYGELDDKNKFIYWLIKQLKSNVDKIDLTSGIQKRDFIYIDDIVSAYETILKNLNKISKYEEFELGSGNTTEVKTFIYSIYDEISQHRMLNTKLNFGVISYRHNENMNMQTDISKLKSLGWSPIMTLEDGIKKITRKEQ